MLSVKKLLAWKKKKWMFDVTTQVSNKFNPHDRSRARRFALQALYQWLIADNNLNEIEKNF